MAELRTFKNAADMYAVLADEIVARLMDGAARRGGASLVVSGGTTPGELFDVLAGRDAPWSNVDVTLSDERWVDPASEASNEHLARTRLLVERAAAATLVRLKTKDMHARDAEARINAAIAAMERPFDIVLLGMGNDGHTASLVPGADGLEHALDRSDPALVRAITPPMRTNMGERMTLTLRAILDTHWIALLLRGDAKMETYKRAIAGTDVPPMPVRAVLNQTDVAVTVFWAP